MRHRNRIRSLPFALAICLAMGLAGPAQADTPFGPIVHAGPFLQVDTVPPTILTLVVTQTGTISDLNVGFLGANGWCFDDIVLKLKNVNTGIEVDLIAPGDGSSSCGFLTPNFLFDDEAAVQYMDGMNQSGPVRPDGGFLSAFDGIQLAGTWELHITDDCCPDEGDNLSQWSLSGTLSNVPDGFQAGYTTSGTLRQGVAAVAGQTCTASVWVGKRSDGLGTWGYWYLQLYNGSWTHTVMFGSLAAQSANWVQYSNTFTIPAFLSGALSLQLTGYYGWETYDLVSLICEDGAEQLLNNSFEDPDIPDGQWSIAFGNPPPAVWTRIGGAGHFDPNTTQISTFP